MSQVIVLATNNAHKLQEIREILGPLGIAVRPLEDFPEIPEPPEEEPTFEGNALSKARFVYQRTGLPTAADDSGLAVDALGGRPGVRSKRYSQDHAGRRTPSDSEPTSDEGARSGGGVESPAGRRGPPDKNATHSANNALLLRELDGVADADRTARFVCALALVTDNGERALRGTCEGAIGHALRGEHGFGYDPLFLPAEAPGRSLAELTSDQKNAISHRGRAFRRLPELLRELL